MSVFGKEKYKTHLKYTYFVLRGQMNNYENMSVLVFVLCGPSAWHNDLVISGFVKHDFGIYATL